MAIKGNASFGAFIRRKALWVAGGVLVLVVDGARLRDEVYEFDAGTAARAEAPRARHRWPPVISCRERLRIAVIHGVDRRLLVAREGVKVDGGHPRAGGHLRDPARPTLRPIRRGACTTRISHLLEREMCDDDTR